MMNALSIISKILLFSLLVAFSLSFFCSSTCKDSSSCINQSTNGCTTCSQLFYNPSPINTLCTTLNSQNNSLTIIAHDLIQPILNLNNQFISNNLVQFACGSYLLSGRYIKQNYLSKRYVIDVAKNHYKIVIKFNVAYIGSWIASDLMHLKIFFSNQDFNGVLYNWTHNCNHNQNICGTLNDCIDTKQFTIKHNSSVLLINFTSSIIQTNPSVKFWGIRDLIIASVNCHKNCKSCYGGSNAECLQCNNGYYLLGNYCGEQCPLYYIPSLKKCIQQCPSKYYLKQSTNLCQECQAGCQICVNNNTCLLYDTSQNQNSSLWLQKLELWIFLIIFCGIILLITLYYIFCRPKIRPYQSQSELKQKKSINSFLQSIFGVKFSQNKNMQNQSNILVTEQNTKQNINSLQQKQHQIVYEQNDKKKRQYNRNYKKDHHLNKTIQGLEYEQNDKDMKSKTQKQKNSKIQRKGF